MSQRIDKNDGNYGNFHWRITNGFFQKREHGEKGESRAKSTNIYCLLCVGTVLGIGNAGSKQSKQGPCFHVEEESLSKHINS